MMNLKENFLKKCIKKKKIYNTPYYEKFFYRNESLELNSENE